MELRGPRQGELPATHRRRPIPTAVATDPAGRQCGPESAHALVAWPLGNQFPGPGSAGVQPYGCESAGLEPGGSPYGPSAGVSPGRAPITTPMTSVSIRQSMGRLFRLPMPVSCRGEPDGGGSQWLLAPTWRGLLLIHPAKSSKVPLG